MTAGFAKAVLSYMKHARVEDLHDLHGCLLTLYHTVCGNYDCKGAHVRVTVHVADPSGSTLQQVLDYIGDQRGGGGAGRTFPVQSGITGKAFRERHPYTAKCTAETHDAYVQDLVQNWHYTQSDARARQPDTRSWFALPIQLADEGEVLGILYVDSTAPDFFDDESRLQLISHAAVGIAFFVGQRYSLN